MRLALVALVLVLLGAMGYLGYDYLTSRRDERDLDRLAERVAAVLEEQQREDLQAGASQPQKPPPQKLVSATVELMPAAAAPRALSATARQPTVDANGIPVPAPEPDAVALTAPTQSSEPTDPTLSIDADELAGVVEEYIARDAAFANPAIEVLRLRIEPGAEDGAPKVTAQLMGAFLRMEPGLTELEDSVSAWLKEKGYSEPATRILDLKMHIQMPMLEQYADLYNQNRDMIGWIRIDATQVNYPVMQTPGDPEFYLRANFERQYAYSGLPFMDARNDPFDPMQNLIIYAHNMKSGSMFGTIPRYESKSYWQNHPKIQLDLLTEQREYEIFSAFYSREYEDGEVGFRYYDYIGLRDLNSFTEYVNGAKETSFYDTGITPAWGDQLLTLSTCSYHADSGKFVVVARRVS